MTRSALPAFDGPDLAATVERLPPEGVDTLPFGAIRVDLTGSVRVYGTPDRRLSASGNHPRLGLHFFGTVVPCMGVASGFGLMPRSA
jgi:hypothetical protein